MRIGKRIKKIRVERGISQVELGKMVYLKSATICQYERERTNPDLETLGMIANALNVSINSIIGFEECTTEELIRELNKREEAKKIITNLDGQLDFFRGE